MDDDAQALTGIEPLAGGHSGRTFVGEVAGERAVVRIYPPGDPRGVAAPEVDEAVLRLVRGLLPVPEVLEVRRPRPATGEPGLLVTGWCEGERGDLVVARLLAADDAGSLVRLGCAVGTVAGMLATMPMLRPGPFTDAGLEPGRFPDGGLVEWVEDRLGDRTGDWSQGELDGLRAVARDAQDRLDGAGRACLVHGDLNPRNLLVDPGTLAVTAVLDWEYAHAGHPWTDLGNLLRFERHPAWTGAVLGAYRERVPNAPEADALLAGARAADLWALVDLAARVGDNPVADRAAALVREVARTGDLHATPYA